MVSALVLINCDKAKINQVAQELSQLEGISEVYSVAGRFDLVAIIRVPGNDQLADVVTRKMLQVNGITKSETLIAFQVFSKHDLERMFSIGFN